MTEEREDAEHGPERESEVRSNSPAPRAARFGEGPEGRGARRERGDVGPRDSALGRAGRFVHDTRAEMNRVSWPTGLEVRNTTIITIIAVIFFAIYLWGIDKGFSLLVEQIQKLVS
jgi:preprotein translocase SecE subunit